MKKWLIGGGILGALAAVLLVGSLAAGALAQGPTPPQATITPEEAKAAVLEAYPGTTVVEVELEREHGTLVYEVGLDNGLEVLVDAGDGIVVGPEQETADDADDVQDGSGSEVEDADEPGDVDGVDDAEDASDSTGG